MMALHFTNNALYPLYVRAEGGGVTVVGLFMGVYALAAVAGRPVVGWLIDRSGPVAVLVAGSLCISLPAFGYAALQGSGLNALVWMIRAVQGFGYGAHFSAAFTLAARIAPAHRRNEAIAMYGISGLAGASVGPSIGETIIRTFGLSTFFVSMGCLGGVAILLISRLRFRHSDTAGPTVRAIISAFRTPRIAFAALLAFLLALCSSAPQSFLAVVAGARGIEGFSLYFTAWGIGGVLVRIVGGRWGDRVGVRHVLVPAYFLYGAGLAILSAADHVIWVVAAGLLSGTAHGLAFPAVTTFGYLLVPQEISGSAVALITGMMDTGAAFMSMGVGAMAGAFHHDIVFPIASAAACTAAVLVAVDIRRHPGALFPSRESITLLSQLKRAR
ncbi:MAG: MFS transporter [Bacteroidota bacterium]|nr:MFS transporter [Bacteroidota bacterium]